MLLSGAAPETILCLTFTKAAAAEMANRIGARLAAWVRMKDADLKKDLFALSEPNDPPTMRRARRLFARVLEAPGGLRIQTIHAFAQTLLASFPAEAGIAPGFQPLEGRAEQELGRTTLATLLADAEAGGNEQLLRDVQCLSLRLGEMAAVEYLMRCARSQEALKALGPAGTIEAKVRALMNLPDDSLEDYLAHHCGDDRFDCDLLRAVADANRRWGAQTGLGHAEVIEDWLTLTPIERAAALTDLRKVVLTDKDTLRVSAGQARAEPHYEAHAGRLANLIGELLQIQNGARLACDIAAGLRAGQAFADAYARAKRAAGVADFDDLIRWTRELLAQPGMGQWVRYKLDQRTDHVLVDEAQDTNPAQWDIVWNIVEEYFAGAAEGDRRMRTLFMVGDFKQAIYGFQGTRPEEFDRMRNLARQRSEELRAEDEFALEFRDLLINASYRSAQPVLDTVDAVIRDLGFGAMKLPELPPPHVAHHLGRPGLVELWKPFTLGDDEDGDEVEEGWLDADARQYADRIAEQVRAWIDEAPVLDFDQAAPDSGRYPDPGSQPRRACIAHRRAPFPAEGARRGYRPVVPFEAVRGARPPGRGDLRGAAAGRSQSRELARIALDRLDAGAAVRSRLRPREGAAVATSARSGRRARRFRGRACSARRTAGDGGLYDAVPFFGNDPVGPAPGSEQALCPPGPGGSRPD